MTATRILIIEDDQSLSDILVYNFRQAGYDVLCARDGAEGLDLARKRNPELILLDLMLPTMDGLEICRRLRQDSVTRDVMVVMLTAKAEEVDQVVGFAIGPMTT
ncbi:MAG: response regulator [Pirellulaceae bacterium]